MVDMRLNKEELENTLIAINVFIENRENDARKISENIEEVLDMEAMQEYHDLKTTIENRLEQDTIVDRFNIILKSLRDKSSKILHVLNNPTNLKLYDIAYEHGTDGDFDLFCEQEYDMWKEYQKDMDLKSEYIGRTSSFYLNSENFDMYENEYSGKITKEGLIRLVASHSGIDTEYLIMDSTGFIVALNDISYKDGTEFRWDTHFFDCDIEEFYRDLEDSLKTFFEEFENVDRGYKYIEDFKKSQLETYKEFLGDGEEEEI